MCERKSGEGLISYLIRQVAEKPSMVLSVIGLVAAGVLYTDMRQLMKEQSAAYMETAKALQALTMRIENLEKSVNK